MNGVEKAERALRALDLMLFEFERIRLHCAPVPIAAAERVNLDHLLGRAGRDIESLIELFRRPAAR